MYGLKTRPVSLVPCRYLHILFASVSCDALVLFVNQAHWWTSNDISGLVFLFQIQNHPYNISIWVGPISLSLITICVCSKRSLNLGGCWQPNKMLHLCGFQDFADQSSLTKLKSTIIPCLNINAQELRHWLSLWVFPNITGTILLERIHDIINIRFWNWPKETIIHVCHTNNSLRHKQAGIQLAHHKTALQKIIHQLLIPYACGFGLTIQAFL